MYSSCYPERNFRGNQLLRWFDWFFAPILKFDERFARQYRYELPPEFPLASPYSSIVHHLSGPNKCALARVLLRRSGSAGAASCDWHLELTFVVPLGFCSRRLAQLLDSLVRVSRRVGKSHFDKISRRTLRPKPGFPKRLSTSRGRAPR